jgi:hypothetical protein
MILILKRIAGRVLYFMVFICFLPGCLFDGGSDTIIHDYNIAWIDVPSSNALYKQQRIVPPCVYAVGYTERYIMVKQHPLINKSIKQDSTLYFVVEISNSVSQDKPVFGPLDQRGYDSLSNILGVSHVPFKKEYPKRWHWKRR